MLFNKKQKKIAKLEKEEKEWAVEKNLLEREIILNNEKEAIKGKKKKPSTSKLLIFFLFLNCTIIEVFTGWAMIKMLSIAASTGLPIDFTPLVALIGAVVGEVIGYGIYSIKSAKENSQGGIVYDSLMRDTISNSGFQTNEGVE